MILHFEYAGMKIEDRGSAKERRYWRLYKRYCDLRNKAGLQVTASTLRECFKLLSDMRNLRLRDEQRRKIGKKTRTMPHWRQKTAYKPAGVPLN